MNIAGGAQQVKQDAANLGISADEKVRDERGLAGFFSARDSNTRAEALGVRSRVTDLPDGMGMNIAGGAQQVKQDAADLGISADEKVQTRSLSPCSATPKKIPFYTPNHCEKLFPKHTTQTGHDTRPQGTRTRRTRMLASS